VVPLRVRYELYRGLGWSDRAENINKVFANWDKVHNHFK